MQSLQTVPTQSSVYSALPSRTHLIVFALQVIMNVVGPVIVTSFIDHPNVTAVLNAQLPGQESGNSLVDVRQSPPPPPLPRPR